MDHTVKITVYNYVFGTMRYEMYVYIILIIQTWSHKYDNNVVIQYYFDSLISL